MISLKHVASEQKYTSTQAIQTLKISEFWWKILDYIKEWIDKMDITANHRQM